MVFLPAFSLKEVLSLQALGARFENVLDAYRECLGGNSSGVPRELLAAATPTVGELRSLHMPGPADAVAEHSSEDESQACPQIVPATSTKKSAAPKW